MRITCFSSFRMQEFQHNIAIESGINDYTHGISPLRTAANDADYPARILERDHSFEVPSVIDIDDTIEKFRPLSQEELSDTVNANDRVLFYYAGHGIVLDGAGK